jgi:hypothetical protein
MALSPLNSDDIKVGGDPDKLGFLEPFYQGMPKSSSLHFIISGILNCAA